MKVYRSEIFMYRWGHNKIVQLCSRTSVWIRADQRISYGHDDLERNEYPEETVPSEKIEEICK